MFVRTPNPNGTHSHSRVVERARRTLVALPLEARPAALGTELPPRGEKPLVRVVFPAGVVYDNHGSLRVADEVREFVVGEDELRPAVFEDVRDLAVGETSVDGANDSLGS